MNKKYIILWDKPSLYWCGDGMLGKREIAKEYELSELPEQIQSRSLYKIGNNSPLSWFYVSTCGKTSTIELK